MNIEKTDTKCYGHVFARIEHKCGKIEEINFKNTILKKGREALASSLSNNVGNPYDFYISRMIFGDGGYTSGQTKYVESSRNGLFGITRASKSVISSLDSNVPSQATFTSVLTYSDANGYALNEMALQMNNGELYSMVTFPDLTKTDSIQVVWNWRLSFV